MYITSNVLMGSQTKPTQVKASFNIKHEWIRPKTNTEVKEIVEKCYFDCNENRAKQLVRTWVLLGERKVVFLTFQR